MKGRTIFTLFALVVFSRTSFAQKKTNDVTTPLHLMKPDYPVPYRVPSVDNVKQVLDRIYKYLNAVTPAQFADK